MSVNKSASSLLDCSCNLLVLGSWWMEMLRPCWVTITPECQPLLKFQSFDLTDPDTDLFCSVSDFQNWHTSVDVRLALDLKSTRDHEMRVGALIPTFALYMWSLHLFTGYSDFLPQSRNMHGKLSIVCKNIFDGTLQWTGTRSRMFQALCPSPFNQYYSWKKKN